MADELCRFMNYVEKTLAARPAEAGLGGVPSMQNKIRAFLNVKYQKQGAWTNSSLEVRPSPLPCLSAADAERADRQQHASLGAHLLPPPLGTRQGRPRVRDRERAAHPEA